MVDYERKNVPPSADLRLRQRRIYLKVIRAFCINRLQCSRDSEVASEET